MKKLAALVLAVWAATALLAGCNQEASSKADPVSVSSSAVSSGTSGGDASVYTVGASSDDSGIEKKEVLDYEKEFESFSGELTDIAMNQMHVELKDGTEITFVYMDADVSGFSDGRPGDRVTVYYTGEFNGKNSDGIEVVAVVDEVKNK